MLAATIASGPLGAATYPAISVAPLGADCGALPVGHDAACEGFAVTNLGFGSLRIGAVALADTDAADFAVDADGCSGATLGPGASCEVSVRFAPRTAGAKSASLLIPSNDPDLPAWNATLSGTALPPPDPTGGAPGPAGLALLALLAGARRRRAAET